MNVNKAVLLVEAKVVGLSVQLWRCCKVVEGTERDTDCDDVSRRRIGSRSVVVLSRDES